MSASTCFRFASVTVAASLVLLASNAYATDLTTDPDTSGDPNGAPPPPPNLPPPGTVGSPTPPPAPGTTAATLQQATDEDTGIGLHFVYFQPEIGAGFAHLGKVTAGNDMGTKGGYDLGLGAGLEFIVLQVGARVRMLSTPSFNLWTLGGELAYQPGSGRFWPRFGLSLGYAWANNWNQDFCGSYCNLVDVHGVDAGLRAGFQYYVSSHLEVGLDAGLDLLFLKRTATTFQSFTPGANGTGQYSEFAQSQSSTGFMGTAMAHIGFHWP